MALPQIRNAEIYGDGLRIGKAKSNTYDISPNKQSQVGAEGYIGHSFGAKLTKLEFDEIITNKGLSSNVIRNYLMKDKSVVMAYFAGGELYIQEMEITQATITGEALNGTLSGKFTFEGGKPRIALPG